jgi:hypothetical protein
MCTKVLISRSRGTGALARVGESHEIVWFWITGRMSAKVLGQRFCFEINGSAHRTTESARRERSLVRVEWPREIPGILLPDQELFEIIAISASIDALSLEFLLTSFK